MKRLFLLLSVTLIFLAGCSVNSPAETLEETVSRPQTIDGRLAFENFASFADYWKNLTNKDEAFLEAAEQRNGYTSQRSAAKALVTSSDQEDAAIPDPFLQAVLNEQGLVQIADRVFLVTDENVISIPSEVLSSVDLDALASTSADGLSSQNLQGMDIAYSAVEWSGKGASADGIEARDVIIGAVYTFIKKYIIQAITPRASSSVDTCKRTYWRGSTPNKKRRIIGVSGGLKLSWVRSPGNPATLVVLAGTGNANAIYLPRSASSVHVNMSKNFRVSGRSLQEYSARVGTAKHYKANAAVVGKTAYWAAGYNVKLTGASSTTRTVFDKGSRGYARLR